MGLDITSYKNATPVPADLQAEIDASPEPADAAYNAGVVIPYINSDFPGREEGVADGIAYDVSRRTIDIGMSYGGYNAWRAALAAMVGIPNIREWFRNPDMKAPFAELINFADNEGTIGPVVCARLALDFDAWAERAAANDDVSANDRYERMRAIFKHAAGSGFVVFS